MSIDIREEISRSAMDTVEFIIIKATPQDIIDAVDAFIDNVSSENKTGLEKFMWVFEQSLPLVFDFFKGALMMLIQSRYDTYKLENENASS